ncbi:MAG: peptide chain release factor N(5)-glutamine methyltransferase [Lachnospiraceae bacterium]|jgi:release factor glutamine methyltransferase|nr:peptide chain release factor N(5)-glutamine methyltransferase [Lachnospiraceae bacterium]
MTWRALLESGKQQLLKAGIAEYELDAWYLFERAFGLSRAQYLLFAPKEADEAGETFAVNPDFERRLSLYRSYLTRRSRREPLQHILGVQEFMGLEFLVDRHVLIPRQDTETLVETVLAAHKEKKIRLLDMCTGSGCIAVSLLVHGCYASVEAADFSAEALAVARQNAARLTGGFGNVHFRQSDLFAAFTEEEKFDVIVSNPPYIPSVVIGELEPEVRDFEPRIALDGAGDGLSFYRRLAVECKGHIRVGGHVYFEIGCEQGEAVKELLLTHGYCEVSVRQDLAGKDRVVCGVWLTA